MKHSYIYTRALAFPLRHTHRVEFNTSFANISRKRHDRSPWLLINRIGDEQHGACAGGDMSSNRLRFKLKATPSMQTAHGHYL
jgi:hypothetical protein